MRKKAKNDMRERELRSNSFPLRERIVVHDKLGTEKQQKTCHPESEENLSVRT